MELANYLSQENVITFFLLFIRTGALMVFFPFFNGMQIPAVIKTSLSLLLAFFLFPLTPLIELNENFGIEFLILESLSEILFGLCAGSLLVLTFTIAGMAGEQISMIMGFSMANVMDPQTGLSSPIIVNALNTIILISFLLFDGHHIVLQFLSASVKFIPLGGFIPRQDVFMYIFQSVSNMFLFGFVLAFPIIAVSWMADLIFGMLMKTMPQFNLLVVGFPIKISIAFTVLIAIVGTIIQLFTTLISNVLNNLPNLFF